VVDQHLLMSQAKLVLQRDLQEDKMPILVVLVLVGVGVFVVVLYHQRVV
jgi:hypothetical protein